jgi:hypothetical protein
MESELGLLLVPLVFGIFAAFSDPLLSESVIGNHLEPDLLHFLPLLLQLLLKRVLIHQFMIPTSIFAIEFLEVIQVFESHLLELLISLQYFVLGPFIFDLQGCCNFFFSLRLHLDSLLHLPFLLGLQQLNFADCQLVLDAVLFGPLLDLLQLLLGREDLLAPVVKGLGPTMDLLSAEEHLLLCED